MLSDSDSFMSHLEASKVLKDILSINYCHGSYIKDRLLLYDIHIYIYISLWLTTLEFRFSIYKFYDSVGAEFLNECNSTGWDVF